MVNNKVKVEIQRSGTKVTLTVEGDNSALADDLLSSVLGVLQPALNSTTTEAENSETGPSKSLLSYAEMTTMDRLKHLVRSFLKHGWFDSKEVLELYMHYLDSNVPPSTISTYLARLSKDRILERRGSRTNLQYRLRPEQLAKISEIPLTVTSTSDFSKSNPLSDVDS